MSRGHAYYQLYKNAPSGGWQVTKENISNDGEGFVAGGGENNHLGYSGVVILTLSVQEINSINAVITMKEVWALNEFGTESDQKFYLFKSSDPVV